MDAPEVVWKFPLPMGGWGIANGVCSPVHMPEEAHLLTLQVQQGVPTLWAQVNPEAPVVRRIFQWVGTGQKAPADGTYVGTVQLQGGQFVFHLYEVGAA